MKSLLPSKYIPRNGKKIGSSIPRTRSNPRSTAPPKNLPLMVGSIHSSGNSATRVNTAVISSRSGACRQILGNDPSSHPVGQ
jgi:hypothetical protein